MTLSKGRPLLSVKRNKEILSTFESQNLTKLKQPESWVKWQEKKFTLKAVFKWKNNRSVLDIVSAHGHEVTLSFTPIEIKVIKKKLGWGAPTFQVKCPFDYIGTF